MSDRTDRWRWRLADILNKSSRTCWCALVDWALASNRPRDERAVLLMGHGLDRTSVLIGDQTGSCRRDASERGACYCAKFRTSEAEASGVYQPGTGFIVPTDKAATR